MFFLPLLLNKNKINKNENTEYHDTLMPFNNQLYSKPGSSIFLLFGSRKLLVNLTLGQSQNFSDSFSLPILVDIQRLHENIKWSLRASNGAKWLNVRLWSKWLWDRFPLQLLKLKISRLSQAMSSSTFRQLQSVDSRVYDMLRTHSCPSTVLLNYFIHSIVKTS